MKLIVLRTIFDKKKPPHDKCIDEFEERVHDVVVNVLKTMNLEENKDFVIVSTYGYGKYFKELEMEVFDI